MCARTCRRSVPADGIFLLFFFFGFAFTGNVKDAVFDYNFYVLLSYFGQVGFEQILMIVFDDIHRGDDRAS